ncbi:unnamed protein product [Closterium sp. Naga37s-1]|nr:unnamed protein product [Closterium sp. Naga37s-1]
MVIAGAPKPSPGLAAAWSGVVARPPAGLERATMATEPPLPPAPNQVTAVSEKTPPHAPAAPLAGAEAGPTAPAAVPSAPPASPGSLAPLVEPSASAPAGGVAEPPAPVPGARVAPNASAPCLPAQASASSPKVASATTGEPAPSVVPAAVGLSTPAMTAVVPAAPSPAVSAPAPGSRLHLPPVPPVVGVEFVAAGGGSLAAPFALPTDADEPLQFLAEALQPPQTRVPEATLGQLHRLADSLHALLLIQVLAHLSLPVIPPETSCGRQRDSCLDAADQLAVLLAPVLAAPVEGGAAAAGQLDEAVRGLRRHLRAGPGAAAIGASTLVVRELWRSLTGVLHALGAHGM